MTIEKANKQLSRAKIGIMSENNSVFITTILFSLKSSWDQSEQTAATDGLNLFINMDWWLTLSPQQQIGLLAHETWHVAFEHMVRSEGYVFEKYNKAADHVINLMLLEAGFQLPPNGLHDSKYKNMTTEQVYALLPDEPEGSYPCDIKLPASAEGKSKEEIQAAITNIVMKAAQQSKMQGDKAGTIPGEIEIALDNLLNPLLPWNVILQNYMSTYAKEDYSFRRPNKRFAPDFYLPSMFSEAVDNIAVGVDTSGSVTDQEFLAFITEINDIREQLNPKVTTIVDFDYVIRKVHTLEEDDSIRDVTFSGRGGTDLEPLFEHFNKNPPTVLIVFSDLYCTKITEQPTYDVIWICVNNPRATVDFGTLIHIKI